MTLNRFKIGQLITQRREKYNGLEDLPVRGVTRDGFIPPKQAVADKSLYNVFYKGDFVFNPARMELNSIAYNSQIEKGICSSLYEIFYVSRPDIILPEYLNMFVKRDEFARKCWFNAIGSARNYFRVPDLSEFEIEVPSLDIQKKYVEVYEGLLMNLHSYDIGLDDLKLVCDGFIEDLKHNQELVPIGPYIEELCEKNNGRYSLFQGVNVDMVFTEPKRVADDINSGKVVHFNEFAFNKVMKANCTKLPIALRKGETCVISGSYTVFKIKDENVLIPDYLMLWLSREETQRWAGFVSYGTTRDIFDFDTLCTFKIPIPSIEVQKSICEILVLMNKRKEIEKSLADKITDACPILIRGSIMEAKGGN